MRAGDAEFAPPARELDENDEEDDEEDDEADSEVKLPVRVCEEGDENGPLPEATGVSMGDGGGASEFESSSVSSRIRRDFP